MLQETKNAKAVLDNEDPDTLDSLITWLYTNEYVRPAITALTDQSVPDSDLDYHTWCKEDLPGQIQCDIGIYLCADRFFMEDLKSESCKRLLGGIIIQIEKMMFSGEILEPVFDNTKSSDPIRAKLVQLMVGNHRCRNDPLVIAAMKRHEPVAWEVCVDLHDKMQDEIDATVKKVTAATAQTKIQTRKFKQAINRVVGENAIRDILKFLKNGERCAKCKSGLSHTAHDVQELKEGIATPCRHCQHCRFFIEKNRLGFMVRGGVGQEEMKNFMKEIRGQKRAWVGAAKDKHDSDDDEV